MGYESDVIFALDKGLIPYFLTIVSKDTFFVKNLFTRFTLNKNYLGEGHYLFHMTRGIWDGVQRQYLVNVLDEMENDDNIDISLEERGLPGVANLFRYIVLGEDLDDRLDKGWAFMDEICIQQTIKF